MPGLQFLVANKGTRGRRKVVARKSFASRVKRAKSKRNPSRSEVRGAMKRGKKRVKVTTQRNRLGHFTRQNKRADGLRKFERAIRRQRDSKGHFVKQSKRNPARRIFAAFRRKKAAVTKAAHKSGTYSFGSLPKVNPRKRAKSGAGAKRMARKRGKKLKGKAKKQFLARMARGRRKAAGGGKVRRRRAKAKSNPAHKVRRRRKSAKRNPSVRRRYRSRRNGPALERAHPGASKSLRRKSRKGRKVSRKRRGSSSAVRKLTAKIDRLIGGKRRQRRGKRSVLRSASSARLSALRVRRRVARGGPGVSSKARAYLRVHGLSKVNPGGNGVLSSLKAIPGAAVEVLAVIGSTGGAALAGAWIGKKLVAKWGASWAPFASAGASAVLGVLGFLGLRMLPSQKVRMLSVPVLAGSGVAAVYNALASNHVPAVGTAPAESWGRRLGFDIGAVIYRSEVNGFDPYARHQVNAMGEVISRREAVNAMGEVIPRTMTLGEAEEVKLQRLLAEVQLQNDSSSGF